VDSNKKSLNDQTAKVVPFFTRYKTPLRYIAAASIVAVILTVVTINKQQNLSAVTVKRVSPSAAPRHTPPQNKQFTPAESGEDDNETNKTVTVTPLAHHEGLIKRTLAYIRPQNISPALAFRKNFIPQKAVEKALFDPSLDDFMVYSDADGNVMKLPKKLFILVCCKDGDGSCNVRLQRLRQTLSANIAPVDFVGMIDMLRQLQ